MNKVKLYLMANDTKWVVISKDMTFIPFSGMDIEGLAGEQPLRISGMSYDFVSNTFKFRLSWLSSEPLTSKQLYDLNVGWEEAVK
jgi:hypothetical protein